MQWCGPCKAISPHFEAHAIKHPDAIFLYIDTDQMAADFEEACPVGSLPDFRFYKAGKILSQFLGASVDKLSGYVEMHCKPE